MLKAAYDRAGFREIEIHTVSAPVRTASAPDFVRFAQESFGALHQMMTGLTEAEREETWAEITQELRQFEWPVGFVGPCEVHIGIGIK